MPGSQLRDVVQRIVADWHPNLRELVSIADEDTISVFPFRTSPRLTAWEPSVVTLLGDAIHSMPPTAGAGANTALHDANALRLALLSDMPLVEAIGTYEAAMRPYAQKYVDVAMKNLTRALSDNSFGLAMGKASLRIMNRIGPLRRKMAAARIN
jgi:2-polyprenyl-6-methoxyphenol hydroxylase-like FAD-dependent oxidoreductase